MAKNKLSLDFPMYDHLKKQLEKAGGNALKTAVDKALTESARYTDEELEKAIAPHRKSGRTEKSLEGESRPEWSGTNAQLTSASISATAACLQYFSCTERKSTDSRMLSRIVSFITQFTERKSKKKYKKYRKKHFSVLSER